MNPEFTCEELIEIPFHDVDAMRVVWHGHYFKYLEIARCSLLRSFNYDYPQMFQSNYLWPVIECKYRFSKPALYGYKLKVVASLAEYENRLKIDYLVLNAESEERLGKGYTVQVAVDAKTHEMCVVSPDILFERLNLK